MCMYVDRAGKQFIGRKGHPQSLKLRNTIIGCCIRYHDLIAHMLYSSRSGARLSHLPSPCEGVVSPENAAAWSEVILYTWGWLSTGTIAQPQGESTT